MAEATQYSFTWVEIAETLIKKQDIHEGEWVASLEFAVNAGIVGQSPTDAKPGLFIFANTVQLAKAQPNSPPHLVVDAAKANPKT
jgi:hypothetical protein